MANTPKHSESTDPKALTIARVRLESEYTCYLETQSDKGRCEDWCKNDNYCKRTVVCDSFKKARINHAICINCNHTEKMHLKSQTET